LWSFPFLNEGKEGPPSSKRGTSLGGEEVRLSENIPRKKRIFRRPGNRNYLIYQGEELLSSVGGGRRLLVKGKDLLGKSRGNRSPPADKGCFLGKKENSGPYKKKKKKPSLGEKIS